MHLVETTKTIKRNMHIESKLIAILNGYFNIDIKKRRRLTPYIYARSIFCKIMLDEGYTKVNISLALDKSHATVIHSLKMFEIYYSHDRLFREYYNECRQYLKEMDEKIDHDVTTYKLQEESVEEFVSCSINNLKSEVLELKIINNALKRENKYLHSQLQEYERYDDIVKTIRERVSYKNVKAFQKKLNTMLNGI